jgi:hypothetical protein
MWAGYVVCSGETRSGCKILVQKPDGKKAQLGTKRKILKFNLYRFVRFDLGSLGSGFVPA